MPLSMENQDTKELLKYCNAGCKMATDSLEQVMPYASDKKFRQMLEKYDKDHIAIVDRCHTMLNDCHEEEEDPSIMAKMMSYLGTEMKMLANRNDKEIAKIMMDGCNMGIQSLCGYLNQYQEADKECRKLTQDLVDIEFAFMKDLVSYL